MVDSDFGILAKKKTSHSRTIGAFNLPGHGDFINQWSRIIAILIGMKQRGYELVAALFTTSQRLVPEDDPDAILNINSKSITSPVILVP